MLPMEFRDLFPHEGALTLVPMFLFTESASS